MNNYQRVHHIYDKFTVICKIKTWYHHTFLFDHHLLWDAIQIYQKLSELLFYTFLVEYFRLPVFRLFGSSNVVNLRLVASILEILHNTIAKNNKLLGPDYKVAMVLVLRVQSNVSWNVYLRTYEQEVSFFAIAAFSCLSSIFFLYTNSSCICNFLKL